MLRTYSALPPWMTRGLIQIDQLIGYLAADAAESTGACRAKVHSAAIAAHWPGRLHRLGPQVPDYFVNVHQPAAPANDKHAI